MLDEILLHDRLNALQAELLKFNKKLSPTKYNIQIEDKEQTIGKSKFLSRCSYILMMLLKIFICITGPTIFPSIIYCIEGSSQLFWQVTAISCIVTLLLTIMVISILHINIKKIKTAIEEMHNSLSILISEVGMLKGLKDIISSDITKKSLCKVLYTLVLLIFSALLCFVAYIRKNVPLFNGSLILTGYIAGILSTIVYDLFINSELLPVHSPYKIKMELTTPTPSPQSKKKLDFSNFREKDTSPMSAYSTPMGVPLSRSNIELQDTETMADFYPNTPPPSYQEAIGSTRKMWLPLNINYFFRLK